MQIDLNEISEVAAIGTMASSDNSCKVTRYSLYYSVDGKEWRNYPEEANAIPEVITTQSINTNYEICSLHNF